MEPSEPREHWCVPCLYNQAPTLSFIHHTFSSGDIVSELTRSPHSEVIANDIDRRIQKTSLSFRAIKINHQVATMADRGRINRAKEAGTGSGRRRGVVTGCQSRSSEVSRGHARSGRSAGGVTGLLSRTVAGKGPAIVRSVWIVSGALTAAPNRHKRPACNRECWERL